MTTDLSRNMAIVDQARTWLGVPWHHQGRSRAGIDCVGLPSCVGRELGYEIVDCTTYSMDPVPEQLLEYAAANCTRVSGGDPMSLSRDEHALECIIPGRIVLWWLHNQAAPQHGGFAMPGGFIHAYRSIGKVVEHAWTRSWQRRVHSVWEY